MAKTNDQAGSATRAEAPPIPGGPAVIRASRRTCPQHGAYLSRRYRLTSGAEFDGPCPACESAATAADIVADAERDETQRRTAAAAQAQDALEASIKRSGVPARYRDLTLDGFVAAGDPDKTRASKSCAAFRDGASPTSSASLTLIGRPGTGKTHLACAIGNAWLAKGRSVMFVTVRGLVRHIRSAYGKRGESEGDRVRDLVLPDLLIVDDVGAQLGTEHEKLLLFDVIDERYSQMRPLIITSNMSKNILSEYLGERMWDRIAEDGAVIGCAWESYRRRAKR